ncbi:MAG: hypothetical protein SW833_21930 [Cyanobacteriota bacterium]|nr:hypothetical protein [Cyanobacteriota bacterium]
MRERPFIIPQNPKAIAPKSPKPLPRAVRDQFNSIKHLNPPAQLRLKPIPFQLLFQHLTPRANPQKIALFHFNLYSSSATSASYSTGV